jgi:hypothetical protein
MSNLNRTSDHPGPRNFMERLKEIDLFFQKKDPVHQTMRRLARRLERAGIPYSVVGGMAVNAHKYERTTGDVDFLLTADSFAVFQHTFVGKQYAPVPRRPRRFLDRTSGITIDFLITGFFPGNGDPGPIAYPDPDNVTQTIDKVRFVDLVTLVQLKLAAKRTKDFADVEELIRFNNLDESFAEHLHPSVRGDYIECLEETRRQDSYAIRRGELEAGPEGRYP